MSEAWVCPNVSWHLLACRAVTKDLFVVGSQYPVPVLLGTVRYCNICKCDAVPNEFLEIRPQIVKLAK